MATTTGTTEFIYLTFNPSVRPEDVDNDEGKLFMDAYNAVAQQDDGYLSSCWGRTVEDENKIVWAIDRSTTPTTTSTTALLPSLTPLLAPSTKPQTYLLAVSEPITQTILLQSRVIELVVLALPATLSPTEKSNVTNSVTALSDALLSLSTSRCVAAQSVTPAWAIEPASVPHVDSPSGTAVLKALIVGWESKEAHERARETEAFKRTIMPIREVVLKGVEGLEMRHVRFQE
ncbi:hypothetical protein AJ80_06514 [Polytolypa hystricis UAMH7299]|uniref:Uncharacterized protein n=1 Tax=Polytolypa hystricis (strain UAMH7299) TaxID=1447883 RepID=A0A2B7XVJ2_POLH7|nr:hypothetical protein AJ80_06514 [Polytolypa hystricis UAMH7299]